MPSRKHDFVQDEFYHIYNRGNEAKDIFLEQENYLFFLRRLASYLEKTQILLICYCLMPNHFHLLLQQKGEILISRLMSYLGTSYAKAFNRRYSRVGHLFQERYQVKHINKTEYLLHLTRYIHMNPVNAGLVKTPDEWVFSSFCDYVGIRNGKLPHSDVIFSMFYDEERYEVLSERTRRDVQKKYWEFVLSAGDEESIKAYVID